VWGGQRAVDPCGGTRRFRRLEPAGGVCLPTYERPAPADRRAAPPTVPALSSVGASTGERLREHRGRRQAPGVHSPRGGTWRKCSQGRLHRGTTPAVRGAWVGVAVPGHPRSGQIAEQNRDRVPPERVSSQPGAAALRHSTSVRPPLRGTSSCRAGGRRRLGVGTPSKGREERAFGKRSTASPGAWLTAQGPAHARYTGSRRAPRPPHEQLAGESEMRPGRPSIAETSATGFHDRAWQRREARSGGAAVPGCAGESWQAPRMAETRQQLPAVAGVFAASDTTKLRGTVAGRPGAQTIAPVARSCATR